MADCGKVMVKVGVFYELQKYWVLSDSYLKRKSFLVKEIRVLQINITNLTNIRFVNAADSIHRYVTCLFQISNK